MKSCIRAFLLLLAFTVAGSVAFAKSDRYRITLTIHDCPDSVMYLGYYYAENSYVFDTALRDKKGRFVFSGDNRDLLPGMYFFSASASRWMDFVVYHEKPFFTFTTDEADWVGNMQVKGSRENEVFFNYKRGDNLLYAEYEQRMAHADSAVRRRLEAELLQRQREYKNQFIRDHPDRMISLAMQATKDVYPSVPLLSPDGDTLSQRQRYEYYMAHYFDSMPLHDDMLVRTPSSVFYQRVMDYFDIYLKGASPETVIAYADSLIERARPSKENFKWLVHTVKEKYLHSNITAYESVVVHMIHRYYTSGDAYWCSASTIDEMTALADKCELLLIGRTAPELILFDTLRVPHSLHHLPHRYKLLVFWSPACGHCKTMVPELYQRYRALAERYDIGAFAVLSEPDDATRPLWHRFIADHRLDWLNLDGGEANIDWHDVYNVVTTPQVYLLDQDNRIMAKKFNAETFQRIVEALCQPKNTSTGTDRQ
ncbi:MAG: alkyl hydroperoxide reductase [bacterium P3]|nr:MAG: alkyl hydroperoxide reductase [bacterium P3]KWW42319.1 MAG: alkyl hydroperoxide reductase [bacterium F083]